MCQSLCQILKALCPSPCCSEYPELMQTCLNVAFGTTQIMIGLFNIGLGTGRTSTYPGDFASLGAAYWLGGVFILTGIMSILAGQCPSRCLVGFTVFMNIVGAIFAITGIVLYAIALGNASLLWMCSSDNADCRTVALIAQNLLTSMDALLIALAVFHLFASIRFAIVGIGALSCKMKKEEGDTDVEVQQQLKEVLPTSPGA